MTTPRAARPAALLYWLFPPLVCLVGVWFGAGAWFVLAVRPGVDAGWRVADGCLDTAFLMVGWWMLFDLAKRGAR